jgi:hypothetical protein
VKRELLVAGAAALLAGAAVWHWKPMPAPTYSGEITIPDGLLLARRPTLARTLGKRLGTERVAPLQAARGTERSDAGRVAGFCAAAAAAARSAPTIVVQTSANGSPPSGSDTTGHRPDGTPPAELPPFSGRFTGKILTLQSTLSDGNPWEGTWRVHTPFEWLADGDSVPVTQPRTGVRVVRGAKDCGIRAAIGGAGGLLLGLLVQEPKGGAIGGAAAGCATGL